MFRSVSFAHTFLSTLTVRRHAIPKMKIDGSVNTSATLVVAMLYIGLEIRRRRKFGVTPKREHLKDPGKPQWELPWRSPHHGLTEDGIDANRQRNKSVLEHAAQIVVAWLILDYFT